MGTERLYRSRTDRMISGVAGGLGHYFGVDPTIVRLFWVLAAIFSGGLAVLAYLALWVLIPEEPYSYESTPPYRSFGSAFSSSSFSASASSTPAGAASGESTGSGEPSESAGASAGSSGEPAGVGSSGPFGESGPFGGAGSSGRPGLFGSGGPFGPPSSYGPADRFGAYPPDDRRRRRSSGAGWALVVLGGLVLASNLHLLSWISMGVVWPVFLIGLGVFLLYRHGYMH